MAPKIQTRETTIFVERSFPNGTVEEEQGALEVRVFETQPATVSAKGGRTINLGNYESLRIDVGVELPCYVEEVNEGMRHVSTLVGKFLAREEKAIKAALAE